MYKSQRIKPEEIKVEILERSCLADVRLERIRITHIPTGTEIVRKSKSQVNAYNEALMILEDRVSC